MKYFFTLLFSIMLIGPANAQNKQETLKWLNKNKKHIRLVTSSGYSSEDFKVEMTDSFIIAYVKNNGEKHKTKLYWSQIKKTTLFLAIGKNGYVTLNTENEESIADSITLHFSDYGAEIREKLTLMANLSGSEVITHTIDYRDVFGY